MTTRHKLRRRDRATSLRIESPAFHSGERIPVEYTLRGGNESPELHWSEEPPDTAAYALVCEDPDAAGMDPFVHWLVGNIPPTDFVPRNVGDIAGAVLGRNNFNRLGYDGPAPPPGRPHHYHFRLYALDEPLSLEEGFTRLDLIRAMQGHVLATGELMTTYSK
jgi:Raf kinase inhibitor-like YbhB/YbcL family protein